MFIAKGGEKKNHKKPQLQTNQNQWPINVKADSTLSES